MTTPILNHLGEQLRKEISKEDMERQVLEVLKQRKNFVLGHLDKLLEVDESEDITINKLYLKDMLATIGAIDSTQTALIIAQVLDAKLPALVNSIFQMIQPVNKTQ